jgi:hypothetical protein
VTTTTPVPTTAGLDLSTLAGDYTCAAAPGGLSWLRAEPHNGTLRVRAFGHGEMGPDSRGEVTADAVFAETPHSWAGYSFLATVDDRRIRNRLQMHQGLGEFFTEEIMPMARRRQDAADLSTPTAPRDL